MKFIDQVPRFALKLRILVMSPLMVMSPFSAKAILVLSLDFGLTGSSFLTCSSSLFCVLKSTICSRNWRHLVCIIIAGSELSLVELGGSTPPHLLKVCSAHEDKVEIKCMGSVGEKITTEPKFYLFFSNLRHIGS